MKSNNTMDKKASENQPKLTSTSSKPVETKSNNSRADAKKPTIKQDPKAKGKKVVEVIVEEVKPPPPKESKDIL
jgi:hypothetical protein